MPATRGTPGGPPALPTTATRADVRPREPRRGGARWKVVVPVVFAVAVAGAAGAYYFGGETVRSYFALAFGVAKPPARAEQYLGQGMTYASMKDYDNAIKEFSRAIELAPSYSVAYANRGVAYMQQKKFNKALDDLKKASELSPKDKMAHYNLAALYALQGQKDRALDSLDTALELGFDQYDALRTDPDLTSIRDNPEFRKVLEKHKVFLK
jgi:Flp pilus assembly protein TadD